MHMCSICHKPGKPIKPSPHHPFGACCKGCSCGGAKQTQKPMKG